MYMGKSEGSLSLFGMNFSSYYSYAFAAVLIATPLLTFANYGMAVGFHQGVKLHEKIWMGMIIFILAQLIAALLSAVILYQEVPSKGTLVGIAFAFAGLIISNLWK